LKFQATYLWTLYFLAFQLVFFSVFKTEGFQLAFASDFEKNKNLQFLKYKTTKNLNSNSKKVVP
jgi:hypothetical protein